MKYLWAACLFASILTGNGVAGENIDKQGDVAVAEDRVQNAHAHFSVECFNAGWAFIEKAERSNEDIEDMLLLAQASLWHWKQRKDCEPLNLSIGYWQVSRVYALAGDYQMARRFGARCLAVGDRNDLPPFYQGYAYEALARAELLDGDTDRGATLLEKARHAMKDVEDKDDRKLLEADLKGLHTLLQTRER